MSDVEKIITRIEEKKQKLDAARPLPPELLHNLDEWFAIEFTYTSTAIEGNTLTHSETALVVEKGITIGGKTIREHLEVINHAQAINFIKELAHKKQTDIALDDILAIHKIVLQNIDLLHAGVFRKINVRISGSSTVFPNSAKVPFLMVEFMQWLHHQSTQQMNILQHHPVIIAALAHFKFVSIHPFVDGNGRTARLLMNLLLIQHGYPLAIIKKEDRTIYINAIEQAMHTGDYTEFFMVICKATEYSLDAYLDAIAQPEL